MAAVQADLTLTCTLPLTSGLRCGEHNDEILQRYCKSCDKLICIDCITESHVGHNLKKYSDVMDNKKNELSALILKTKNETIVDVERQLKKARQLRSEYQKEHDKRIDEVKQRTKILHDEIDKASEEIQDQLEKVKDEYETDFEEADTKMTAASERLNALVAEYEEALSVSDHGKIFEGCQSFSTEVENSLPTANVPSEDPPTFRFDVSHTDIRAIFGQLEDECQKYSDTLDVSDHVCLNKQTFTRLRNSPIRVRRDPTRGRNRRRLNLSADIRTPSRIKVAGDATEIRSIVSVSPNEALVLTEEQMVGGQLWTVKRDSREVKQHQIGKDVYAIDVKDSRTFFFTEKGETTLYSYDVKLQKMAVVRNFAPNLVGGLCVLSNGGIACCVVDSLNYNVTDKSKRALVVISNDAEESMQYRGNSKDNLFTLPSKVTELSNANLCVIDRLSDANGRVIVLTPSSKVQFIYEGLQKNGTFDPCDVTSHRNSIFIVERKFGLHELTVNGQFARYILNDNTMWNPRSVVVDDESKAWIGCGNGYILRMRVAQDTFSLMSIVDSYC